MSTATLTKPTHTTREAWLHDAVLHIERHLQDVFLKHFPDYGIPKSVMVSCGFPLRERGGKVIGQCWPTATSGDKATHHIFVTPRITDPVQVLATLLHELVHAADNNIHQHRGPFVRAVRDLGLAGKPTATYAEKGTPLYETLREIAKVLGAYPHTDLQPITVTVQKTYQLKLECEQCGCIIRMTQKWLDEAGAPQACGCGGQFEQEVK